MRSMRSLETDLCNSFGRNWTSINTSAGRSLGFSLSMFVSDICNQTSDISDYGVEV